MTSVEMGLLVQAVLGVVAGVAAISSAGALRNVAAGSLIAASGAVGMVTGVLIVSGTDASVVLRTAVPIGTLSIAPGPLGGFFIAIAGGVNCVAAVFAIGYAHDRAASRTSWASFAGFALSLQLLPASGDIVTFLLLWELMALTSAVLVFTEHTSNPDVRPAGLWYASMTHLSFLLILLGFAVLAADVNSTGFDAIRTIDSQSASASLAFVLLTLGFATKAGIAPLHVWLPRAHPAAPSHVSAVMSAAMVKMGVFGMAFTALTLLPDGPRWWALVVVGGGAAAALYGILQASVASDVKRLLAYSTTENVGLMFLALGVGMLLQSSGMSDAAAIAFVAMLLLAASHAAFKTTLFLGAGAMLQATGTRDLDRMGGLARRMPATAAVVGLGALGAACLPVSAGFAAEWTLLQALIHGARPEDPLAAVVMPLAVAVVALTTGLALMTFVKVYGIAFLARPRSAEADAATEVGPVLVMSMGTAALAILGLGLIPGTLVEAATRALGRDVARDITWSELRLPAVHATLDPSVLLLLLVALGLPVLALTARAAARRPRRQVELPWGCGGARTSPRMQYTATSFAEPLTRVFDETVRLQRDVQVTRVGDSAYLVERVQFRQRVDDVIETALFRPAVQLASRAGAAARRLHGGNIRQSLMYSFFAVVVVLAVVAL